MFLVQDRLWLLGVFLALTAMVVPASAQEKTPPVGSGETQSLSVLPDKVVLRGAGQL